jgi:hypothetical protein
MSFFMFTKITSSRPVSPIRFATAILACLTWTTAKADITQIERKDGNINIWIGGTITTRDADTFQRLEPQLASSKVQVYLNSPGGSVAAAIAIGRLVRKYDGTTTIPVPSKCYSSCALIFIAGVSRWNYGELGLHRPYFAGAPQSREAVEKQVPLMLSTVKSYVTEMGITDNFYQQMVNTDPSKIVRYNSDTYKTIIPERDPVYDELEASRQARQFGLSTDEYRRRDAEVDKCMSERISRSLTSNLQAKDKAYGCQAIYWGLNEQVWSERTAKVQKFCRFSPAQVYSSEELATLNKTPEKQRWELPFVQRVVSCQRTIMLDRQKD